MWSILQSMAFRRRRRNLSCAIPDAAIRSEERTRNTCQDQNGTYLQVIYVFSPPGVTYVIHARPLTDPEKRRLRRR